MITWSRAAPALLGLIERLAITQETRERRGPLKGRWAGKRAGFIQPSHQRELILRIRSEASTGDDERRIIEIDGQRREVLVGQRRIILEVRVEVLKHQEDADNWAWSTAGLIRTRLERQSSVDALSAISMAAIEIGPSTDISYTYQDREVSAAMFELTLIGSFADVNEDDSVDVFDRALVTSHLHRPDGSELPRPPNYTDLPMGKP